MFELGRISSLAEWEHISELLTGRHDVFPVAVGGPETKDRPRMAELVVGEKRCASCRGAFCRPACPGTGGHLWRWNHGHIRGLSPLQDGLEGYCPFGAGQPLAAGSTRFCAGILSTARHLTIEQKMADYSNKLYQQLEQETGIQTEPLLSSLLRRMPELETLEIVKLVNCPETFTPDMRCIMGESPAVQGYYVLVGVNSAGLSFGGGDKNRLSEDGEDSDASRRVHQAEDKKSQKSRWIKQDCPVEYVDKTEEHRAPPSRDHKK
ncbi:pyruvate dehydrogenase phosphatase regulatory subunit [Prionailurus iriomotensis]